MSMCLYVPLVLVSDRAGWRTRKAKDQRASRWQKQGSIWLMGFRARRASPSFGGLDVTVMFTVSACLLTSLTLTDSCDRRAGWPRQISESHWEATQVFGASLPGSRSQLAVS